MTLHRPPKFQPGHKLTGNRTGSILLIVTGTLICLFMFAIGYARYLSQQSAMADRLNRRQKLGRLAEAVATLAAHKLQFSSQLLNSPSAGLARPDASPALKAIFDYLAQPLAKFSQSREFELPLVEDATAHFSLLVEGLWQAAGFGDELQETVTVVITRDDFSASGPAREAYPREKTGHIGLKINMKLVNADKIISSADFIYSCPVRIATVHAPVLSKFNLYIENASIAGKEKEHAWNQVGVDQFGNFAETRSSARPLVLNNDDNQNLPVRTEFRSFVEAPRGLVYLGGSSRLFLNLARSDVMAPNADSGEGFQFFRNRGFDGFYPVAAASSPEAGRLLISFMDQGVSDDPDNRNTSFYNRILSGHFGRQQIEEGRMNLASIFRLFGTQGKPSPTLVLGHVYSAFLTIARLTGENGRKVNPPILDNLSYAPPMQPAPYYLSLIDEPEYADLKAAFNLDGSPASYLKYLTSYASRIRHRPYNQGLGFLLSQENPDAPLLFPTADPLSGFIKSSDHAGTHQIPAPFSAIFAGVADLRSLSKLLMPAVNQTRFSYSFQNREGQNPLDLLASQNLVSRSRMAQHGWVKFSHGIKIDRPLAYLSHAGIVVEKGDLIVSAPVRPVPGREQSLLYLVTLDGNIIFDNSPEDQLQAAFIAHSDDPDRGRLIFRRPPAAIRGALAMKKLVKNAPEAVVFKGTRLTYFAPLAARPADGIESSGDSELLSFSFSQSPQEL